MSGVNKAIIIGNVGKDPEVRTFQNGGKVCTFSVATSESWKDKTTGEKKERTEWHRISVLNENLVGIAEKYIRKGTKVYVEGQLETRKYTDGNGVERYTTEIVLRPYRGEITLLSSKESGSGNDGAYEREPGVTQSARASSGGFTNKPQDNFIDDTIPF